MLFAKQALQLTKTTRTEEKAKKLYYRSFIQTIFGEIRQASYMGKTDISVPLCPCCVETDKEQINDVIAYFTFAGYLVESIEEGMFISWCPDLMTKKIKHFPKLKEQFDEIEALGDEMGANKHYNDPMDFDDEEEDKGTLN